MARNKNVSFSLDLAGGAYVLQNMARNTVKASADAIASRAESMAASISSNPPTFDVNMAVGTNKRGRRAIATVKVNVTDNANAEHQKYIGRTVLDKSRDAGKI